MKVKALKSFRWAERGHKLRIFEAGKEYDNVIDSEGADMIKRGKVELAGKVKAKKAEKKAEKVEEPKEEEPKVEEKKAEKPEENKAVKPEENK